MEIGRFPALSSLLAHFDVFCMVTATALGCWSECPDGEKCELDAPSVTTIRLTPACSGVIKQRTSEKRAGRFARRLNLPISPISLISAQPVAQAILVT